MCIFSGTGNFRFDVASTQKYKGNRDGFEKPEHWSTVNDYLKENYPNAVVNDREADDYLAERQRRSGNTIICTRDKDLLVTPGWHYRWSCGENQPEVPPHFVSEWEAWFNFFVQCLIGDTTDNILGCGERRPTSRAGKKVLWRFGVGKKSARALLENCHNQYAMYQTVRMEYYKLFGEDWEWKLLENARLLFVGQRADDLFDWSWLNKTWN
jgi:5'-3' exonuclease